uniref:Uncharacterized protein n=1 Tax=Desulfobacca acetoxidans TaxID=60893 RepID=A0A7V6DQN0_9BACT
MAGGVLIGIAPDPGSDRAHGLELHRKTVQTGKEAIANLSTVGPVSPAAVSPVLLRDEPPLASVSFETGQESR